MKPTGILSRLDQAALASHHIWAFVLCFGTAEMAEPSFSSLHASVNRTSGRLKKLPFVT